MQYLLLNLFLYCFRSDRLAFTVFPHFFCAPHVCIGDDGGCFAEADEGKGCRGLSTSSWDGQHVFLFAVSLYVSKQHLHQRGITIQHKVLSGVVAIDNDSKVPQLLIHTGSTEKCITCMLHTAEGFEGLHSLETSTKKLQNLQYQLVPVTMHAVSMESPKYRSPWCMKYLAAISVVIFGFMPYTVILLYLAFYLHFSCSFMLLCSVYA